METENADRKQENGHIPRGGKDGGKKGLNDLIRDKISHWFHLPMRDYEKWLFFF